MVAAKCQVRIWPVIIMVIPLGVSIPISFLRFIREYFARTLLRICSTEIGLVLPLVRREFHSPLVANPIIIRIGEAHT